MAGVPAGSRVTARAGLAFAVAVALAAAPARGALLQPGGGPTVEVRVSKRGFEPSRITVRKGETTRLVVSSSDAEHCFAIDALRVEKRVVPGRPTRVDLTPAQAGSFPFYCCLESGRAAERGELVVTD
jgi:heme/copper-type cytochrome/quinol oxidase subunit 2